MKTFLKWTGALVLGAYLGLLPFLSYMFPVHNPKCPCHGPYKMIQMRWKQIQNTAPN